MLELSPAVCWAVIEILMGGHAKSACSLKRKLTEIEQSIMDGMIRLGSEPGLGVELDHGFIERHAV